MNQKTNSVLLCAALAVGALSTRAQTSVAGEPVAAPVATPETTASSTLTVTPAFASQYMFRGVRLGGPGFQPTVEFASGPVTVGVWANLPISDKVPGQSDPEIDLYGSYTVTINESMSLVPGFTAYIYPRAEENNGFYKLTFEPNLAFNYTINGFKLTPKIYYDTVLKGATYEISGGFAVPLKDAGTEMDFLATYGSFKWTDAFENTSPSVKNYGTYWLVGVSMPFQITPKSKVTVGFAYTKGTDNYFKQGSAPKFENTGAVGRGVVTLAYAFTF